MSIEEIFGDQQAFPSGKEDPSGMTKREFASVVLLGGLLAHPKYGSEDVTRIQVVREALHLADLLITELHDN